MTIQSGRVTGAEVEHSGSTRLDAASRPPKLWVFSENVMVSGEDPLFFQLKEKDGFPPFASSPL
ncbi:hypothetical protein MASR2M17_17210 [Aminivibrio sp.]